MSSLANRFIPLDTLLEAERVNRQPLRQWAEELLGKLAATSNENPESWIDIAGCMNNAALIEVFRGDLGSARQVCDLQLRWVQGLGRTYGLAKTCDLAPQPSINIGRLLRIMGDHEAALARFALLVDTRARRDLQIGPVAIDADTWQDVVQAKNMTGFLEGVYLIDSVKTYFAAKDFAGALRFLHDASLLVGPGVATMQAELEAITLAQLGRYQEALAVTNRDAWARDGYSKLLRVTYKVAIMAASGLNQQAQRLLEQLVPRVLAAKFDQGLDQRVLRYLKHLGVIAMALELPDLAAPIWQAGLQASRQLVDVPLELSFLDHLIDVDGLDGSESLARQRAGLLQRCLYHPLLKARGLVVDPQHASDPVFASVQRRLTGIANSLNPTELPQMQAPVRLLA